MSTAPRRKSERSNRRQHERLDVDAPARLVSGATALEGRIENISSGGAAFITPTMDPEFPVGASVTLLAVGAGEDGAELALPSRVVRTDSMCDVAGDSCVYALAFDQPLETPAGDDAPSGA